MTLVVAMVLAPFLAALAGLAIGRTRPRLVVPVALAGTAVPLVVGAVLAWFAASGDVDIAGQYAQFPTGAVPIGIDLRVDALAGFVACALAVVAFCVQVYSTAYLRGDPRYPSYAAFVSLFTAAMLLVVVADDLFVLLVGWEVMGVCSYFLIGHHWEQRDARAGSMKAFLTTRAGDVGFLFGVFVLVTATGTARISDIVVVARAGQVGTGVLTLATLLLLLGVAGKSAQFPLHTWLPDAMAGPTPVSALIHAATMVAAGVYVVARLYGVFLAAPPTLAVMGVIASVTMLGAALAALAQDDIKRVLAWSTVSQLAYMVAALAVGAWTAATFHLLTHAAFKALLFLAAGCVIHAVGTSSMAGMGGLRRSMPVTFWTMTLGLAALAGLPPLSGGLSKEAVLGAAEEAALHEGPIARWAAWLVLVTGFATVAVTAAYVLRLWLRTFFGGSRCPEPAHEAPRAMTGPLLVLAVPTALLGIVGLRAQWLPRWLEMPWSENTVARVAERAVVGFHYSMPTLALSVALVVLGGGAAYAVWRRSPADDPAAVLGGARPVLETGYHLDAFYDKVAVRPTRALASLVRVADRDVVDAYVRGSGVGARVLGAAVRAVQTGNVQTYLTVLLAGAVALTVGAIAS